MGKIYSGHKCLCWIFPEAKVMVGIKTQRNEQFENYSRQEKDVIRIIFNGMRDFFRQIPFSVDYFPKGELLPTQKKGARS